MTYTQPLLSVLLLVLLACSIRMRRCRGAPLLWAVFAGGLILTWPPADYALAWPLEHQYPQDQKNLASVEAIVVLSSAFSDAQVYEPWIIPDKESYSRCEHAAWLHAKMPSVPLLVCGGAIAETKGTFAARMRELLIRAGVPASEILTEEKSRSTHENAVYGAEILKARGIGRIALVVEAFAMPRAEACFRREGITVVPAPSGFVTIGGPWDDLLPSWKGIKAKEDLLHEVLGFAWYKLRGWV